MRCTSNLGKLGLGDRPFCANIHLDRTKKPMNITLGLEQEQFISQQLAQGKFQSANEVVAMALQVLELQQRDCQAWVEEVREKVDEAAQSLERGEKIPLEVVTDRIQAKFREAREAQG